MTRFVIFCIAAAVTAIAFVAAAIGAWLTMYPPMISPEAGDEIRWWVVRAFIVAIPIVLLTYNSRWFRD